MSDEHKDLSDQLSALSSKATAREARQRLFVRLGTAFVCPRCRVHAHQKWGSVSWREPPKRPMTMPATAELDYIGTHCEHCKTVSLWDEEHCVLPVVGAGVEPHAEMPEEAKAVFEEARLVFAHSPRAAAALARLALEILLQAIDVKGKTLFDRIGVLSSTTSDSTVQKAADVIRHMGNEGIHPGEIDLNEAPETAEAMLRLVNLLTDKLIAEPAVVDAMFDSLPPGVRKAIDRRDGDTSDGEK